MFLKDQIIEVMKNPHHEIIDRIQLSLLRNDFGEEIYL